VRSAEEAEIALWGGAALIDVKEPMHGSLGQATPEVIAEVARRVAGRRPVSAALGELTDFRGPIPEALTFVKWGLSGCGSQLPSPVLQVRRVRGEGSQAVLPSPVQHGRGVGGKGSPPALPSPLMRGAGGEGPDLMAPKTWQTFLRDQLR